MKRLGVILFLVFLLVNISSQASALTLGPYTGRVVDAEDNTPVAGASVLFYWTKYIPQMMHGSSEVIGASLVYTAEDGTYSIARFRAKLGLISKYESVSVVIYEPGYEAYILKLDFLNPYKKPDPSFKKKGYVVRLKRLSPVFDHKGHFEKIEYALLGLRAHTVHISSSPSPSKARKQKMKSELKNGFLLKEEFMRRVEWEEKRRMDKEYPK